ncbi:hypothetical protein QFC21_005035 [Naganishia friedmannii]|uniref:Uncharacterized protein n=1 Tax=Naganishia friedmannii TaxID=89922 RepID=A0ACC2VCW9_9TREE|nr:hypothetical protein QFC21_005035 [Naganishia friedmannii]
MSDIPPGIDAKADKAVSRNPLAPVNPLSSPEDNRMAAKLDFASKGLTQVKFERAGEDEGQEARLHGTAMYSPTPGWPLGYGNRKASSMADIEFPVKVNFRVALREFSDSISTIRRNIKVHWDLLDNGFDWNERFIALWDVASEGIWAISLYEDATPLTEYWTANITPQLHAAETRWQTIKEKRRRREIHENGIAVKPQLADLPSSGEIASRQDSEVGSRSDVQPPTRSTSRRGAPDLQRRPTEGADSDGVESQIDRFDVSTLQQELIDVTRDLEDRVSSTSPTPPMEEQSMQPRQTHEGPSPSGQKIGEDNVLLAGGRSCQGQYSDSEDEVQPWKRLRRQASMEQAEADRLEVEKGWADAIGLLIQLADGLLPISICLVRTSAIVPLSGYQDGKIVKKMAGDFDGDRVLASGPGAGTLGQAEALTDDTAEKHDLSAVGALEGTLNEPALKRHLRYIAPEAISDKRAIGSLVDVFSWGVAAYELITRRPIEHVDDSDAQDLLRNIHLHSIRPVTPILNLLKSIPRELCDIIAKSVSLDPDKRYSNMCALLHDLHKAREICQGKLIGNARRQYQPGHIDSMSRFVVPPGLVDRKRQEEQLEQAYQKVKLSGNVGTVCCWGPSGVGKSRLIEVWAAEKQASNAGQGCLVGWAKMEQHRMKPLCAFVAIFSSLLDRIFSDPLEDPETWRKRIVDALILLHDSDTVELDGPLGVDWEQYVKQFRSWSYGLLRLFASSSRPLIIVLDDYQWIGAEKNLWEDLLLHPMRHLDNALVVLSYRTVDDTPPDMAPFVDCGLIQVNAFSKDTLQSLVLQLVAFHIAVLTLTLTFVSLNLLRCFHFDHKPGNMFMLYLEQYFDFRLLKWIIKVEQLDRYTTTGVVAFVTSTLKSLSAGAREVLVVLACLPSQGVDVHLLSELVDKPSPIVRTLLDEASTLGSVQITRQQHAQFTHDKHHQAALDLIATEEKAELYISLARKLESKGGDFLFSRADLIMEATALKPDCYPVPEKARIIADAAKRAARAAAVGLAEKYIDHTRSYADISAKELWQENPRLALDLTTIQAEVAMALRRGPEIIPEVKSADEKFVKVERARIQAQDLVARMKIATLLFRLNVTANRIEPALENVRETFSAIGIDLNEPTTTLPIDADEVEAIIDSIALQETTQAPNQKDEIALAVAKLCLRAGATIYSYSSSHSTKYFDHAAQLILSSPAARKHTAAAYTYTMQAISSANILQVESSRAWLKLANKVKGSQKTPDFSAVEAVVVTLEFLNCTFIGDMKYGDAYKACLADNNMDTLIFAGGLDLAGSFLAGRDLRYTLVTGEKILGWLQYDFQPASKAMIAASIQLAANLLEGKYLLPDDKRNLNDLPPLFAIVYWTNSLACGLFFYAPTAELRKRAAQVHRHLQGGAGTMMMFYSGFVLSWFTILNDQDIDFDVVQSTKRKLSAFQHNKDLSNMVKTLDALLVLRKIRDGVSPLEEAVDILEDAIEHLDKADHHLLEGKSNISVLGPSSVESIDFMNRFTCVDRRILLVTIYATAEETSARHARSAYGKCNGFGLVRYVDQQFPEVAVVVTAEVLRTNPVTNVSHEQSSLQPSTAFSAMSDGGLRLEPLFESDVRPKDALKEGMLERKSNLESVLRSFLVLASERSSEVLIQKVLQILMQINRSDWSCLALQDPLTNTLHLRGAGSYESLKVYDIPINKASALCPTTILLRGSVSHKTINTSHSSSSAIQNLFEREPFFRKQQPKHLLMTPLFVQGRFSGSLVLTGKTASSSNTQVSLLATFAAIALEAHSAFASLEIAVEARTAALEQALAHKQTFISSVSHELRTPLYSISGLCAVMQSSSDVTPAQNENLDVIASSAEDLQRIVTAILDMAKLESGGMTAEAIPFELRDTIESSLESVAHISRAKGIELVLENDVSTDPPGRLIGDPHRVRQCLLNLLSNAVKFSRAGQDPAFIKLGWTIEQDGEQTDSVTVTVMDNGIGIPQSRMNRLFHSFSQIDASITRQYARVLGGGDCWAESAEGQGSTFYLMFKVTRERVAPTTIPREPRFQPGPPRRAVVFAPETETIAVLIRNLRYFNVEASRDNRLQLDELLEPPPHFVFIDIDKVEEFRDRLGSFARQSELSKLVYLVALTEVSSAMDTLGLTHDSIVTKPIKGRALYDVTKHLTETKKRIPKKTGNTGSGLDKTYGKKYPLKILYVDDSSVNVMVGRKLLSRFGYNDIQVCYDGLQAVAAAEKTLYDLIIMDLQMPIADGYTATSMIQASEQTGMPTIVALTANADENTRNRCISSGFSGFLSKPLVISTLAETLRTTYEARYPGDGSGDD